LKTNNALDALPVKYGVSIFCGLMILFYLLWAMFHTVVNIFLGFMTNALKGSLFDALATFSFFFL
jgi:hypothetical protein